MRECVDGFSKGGLTIASKRELTFGAVDDLAFANVKDTGALQAFPASHLCFSSLGPLIELLMLARAGALPSSTIDWLCPDNLADFLGAWASEKQQWLSRHAHFGFIRTRGTSETWFNESTDFLMRVQRAAREISRLPGTVPGQMAAAVQELEGNIQEHSNAPTSGVLAFQATRNAFEFVVADRGIGLLRSLGSSPAYSGLNDHGIALELALTDGTSRFNDPCRGHGFRPVFQGLADRRGFLRFRTGDHSIVMDGVTPTLATAQLSQKPVFDGFFASVKCEMGKLLPEPANDAERVSLVPT